MGKIQYSFLKSSVKAYLQMKIARSGPGMVELESEREIAKRFSIARQTVHPVMEELLAESWCIRKEGKRALFTNPDRYTPETRNIGLFSANVYDNDFYITQNFSGIFSAFSDYRTFVHFSKVNSADEDSMVREILNMEFDGLLFCVSDTSMNIVPLLKKLIAKKIPLVAFSQLSEIHSLGLPEKNYHSYSRDPYMKVRTEQIRSLGYKKPFLTARDREVLDCFNRYSGPETVPGSHFNTDIKKLPAQLKKVLDRGEIDLIVADGDAIRYRHLFHFLDHYKGKMPPLMLYPLARFERPEIDSKYQIHYINDAHVGYEEGLRIAEKLDSLIRNKKKGTY